MLLFLASLLVKGMILSALALLVVAVIRRALPGRISAAGRHMLCLAATVALLVLPIFVQILPAWRVVPVLPVSSAVISSTAPKTVPALPPPPVSVSTPALDKRESLPVVESAEQNSLAERPVPFPFTIADAYVLGVLLFLIWMAYGHIRVWRLVHQARPVSLPSFKELNVRESSEVRVPLTVGIGRYAVIILPLNAIHYWPVERLKAALLHEVAHIQRGDYLVQILADIVCALYFLNPFAWLLNTTLRNEAERAADDAALLRGKMFPSDYAAHLLAVIRELGRPVPVRAAVTMARRSETRMRISALLSSGMARSERTSLLTAVTFFGLAAGITLSLARLSSVQEESIVVDPFEKVVPDPRGYKRTLSDGTTIEIISVAENPTWNKVNPYYWKPDSSLYQGSRPYKGSSGEIIDARTDIVKREYAVRLRGPRADSRRFSRAFYPQGISIASGYTSSATLPDNKTDYTMSVVDGAFFSKQNQIGLKVGVRSASQKIVNEIAAASITGDSVTIQGHNLAGKFITTTFTKPKVRPTAGEPQVCFDWTMTDSTIGYRLEVIARTKDQWGKWADRKLESYSQGGAGGQSVTLTYVQVRPEQIKTIRLIHQPYEWVRFDHIAMYPRMVMVPDMRDQSLDKARVQIEKVGLRVGSHYYEWDELVPKGNIVGQTPPAEETRPRGTRIDFILSRGLQPASVYQSPERHSLAVKYAVPGDGKTHHIRIDIADGKGRRTLYNKWHKSGEVVMTDVEREGNKATFAIYDNDVKLSEITGPPFKEAKRN